MPELPEVETIVRELAPRLTGRHIRSAEILNPRIVRHSKHDVPSAVTGTVIQNIRRHGKFIIVELSRGILTIHLGMTGKLLFDSPLTPYTRAVFTLDDSTLVYDDIRMFGSIEWTEEEGRTTRLGPDAFLSSLDAGLLRRRAPVKAILLNQSVFSGVGNIYADEALHRAGIDPRRKGDRLSSIRASRLIEAVKEVLLEAIGYRGSSVSDYVDTEGLSGGFQSLHRVYGRTGLPCPVCATPIRRTVIGGRGTHFCPKCQR